MTTQCEIRVVRFTDGSVDLEMVEFNAEGKIVATLPWDQSWFHAFLGGSKGKLPAWLKEQVINAFNAGALSAYEAGWMADSTTMVEKEKPCTTFVLCAPKE